MLKVVPQFFFDHPNDFEHLYHDFESCILYKSLKTSNSKSDYFIATHVLTIVIKGSKIIQSERGEPIVVRENEMIFIPRDRYLIQDIVADKGTFESWLFFFSDEIICDFLKKLDGNKELKLVDNIDLNLPVFKMNKPLAIVTSGILEIFPSLGSNATNLIQTKLYEILHLMNLNQNQEEFTDLLLTVQKGKRNIRRFMENNYDKPLKVEDYASLTGRSLTSFLREFKAGFNTTPKQWLMSKRMEKARNQLNSGNRNVTQVAYAAGYENISHFIKAFKKEFGISPKQYALQHQTNLT